MRVFIIDVESSFHVDCVWFGKARSHSSQTKAITPVSRLKKASQPRWQNGECAARATPLHRRFWRLARENTEAAQR